ncbi:Protein PAT1 1 [Dermatophagoides farinae]|uniref:Protein PAT1 1 n=1 Tax=Dermatophagoides farinae TaxID=6954 RepID=A0A922HP42_DERFA|nr:Protein PAT1 1 [Dermatophagoides farinae]
MDKFTLERDDIDALNDETFGCDVGEINDDWEEEHEKFVETTHDKSSVFVDTGSIIHCEPKHSNYSGSALSTIGLLNSSMNKHSNDDLLFPNCEDLIAKNLLDVVSDENDIFCTESASSFSLYHYFDADDNDDEDDVDNNELFTNGLFPRSNRNKSLLSNKSSSQLSSLKKKSKAMNIDLDSLRPPSPSILPFDHTFMSSVWRPPSPPTESTPIATSNNVSQQQQQQQHHHTHSPIKKNITSPLSGIIKSNDFDIFRSPNLVIRAEDLEADLSRTSDSSSLKSSTPNRILERSILLQSPFTTANDNNTNHQNHKQLSSSFMGLAALSLGGHLLPHHQQQPSISTAVTTIPSSKTVQPPPGFSTTSSLSGSNNNRVHPFMLMNMTDSTSKSPPLQPLNRNTSNQNNKIQQLSSPIRGSMPPMIDPRLIRSPQQMMNVLMAHQSQQQQQQHQPSQTTKIQFPIPANVIDPILFQQQRSIINKCIITPAQAQRSYHHNQNHHNHHQHYNNNHNNYHHHHHRNNNYNQDRFAGFMTQREKEWLLKVFRLQCKVNDPYVEDYYEVNYMLKKNAHKFLQKQKELMISNTNETNGVGGSDVKIIQDLPKIIHHNDNNDIDDKNNLQPKTEQNPQQQQEPILVLPQMAIPSAEESRPKYIQFDKALGKIQVLNSKCPRKLVELNETDPSIFVKYQLDRKSQYLLKIERLYQHLLNIEDEDKRMPILPDDVKQQHRDHRTELCQKLFNGFIRNIVGIKKDESQNFILINRVLLTLKRMSMEIDPELLAINKGLYLIVRSLDKFEDEQHLVVLTSSLLRSSCFEMLKKLEQKNTSMNLVNMLVKAIGRIKMAKSLIYLVSLIDDSKIFTNVDNKNGTSLLIGLFKQYELAEDKLLFIYFWKLFVQTLIKLIPETEDSYDSCRIHLNYLQQL